MPAQPYGPMHGVCPLSSMLLAILGIIAFDEEPPRAGTRSIEHGAWKRLKELQSGEGVLGDQNFFIAI